MSRFAMTDEPSGPWLFRELSFSSWTVVVVGESGRGFSSRAPIPKNSSHWAANLGTQTFGVACKIRGGLPFAESSGTFEAYAL
jgi:hypothetical protein